MGGSGSVFKLTHYPLAAERACSPDNGMIDRMVGSAYGSMLRSAALMRLLIEALDTEVDKGVDAAWRAEIERRMAELDAGSVETIPWEEVRARLFRR